MAARQRRGGAPAPAFRRRGEPLRPRRAHRPRAALHRHGRARSSRWTRSAARASAAARRRSSARCSTWRASCSRSRPSARCTNAPPWAGDQAHGRRRSSRPSRSTDTPDQARRRSRDHGGPRARAPDGSHRRAATSASARPSSPCAPPFAWCAAAGRSRCSCRPPCSRTSTTRPSANAWRTFRSRWRCSARHVGEAARRKSLGRVAEGGVDVLIGTHRLLSKDVQLQAARPRHRRRGAALRRARTRSTSRSCARASTCSR